MSMSYMWSVFRCAKTGETPVPQDYNDCVRAFRCGARVKGVSGRLAKEYVPRDMPPDVESVVGTYDIDFDEPYGRRRVSRFHGNLVSDHGGYSLRSVEMVGRDIGVVGDDFGMDVVMGNDLDELICGQNRSHVPVSH
ncbi:MAG: hypothetical protein DRO99_00650 [Candidatus Aenigmatarchaeota archaeon]|nr:MAG: hypothetical protein DRO99_00650 [Candidatus Aenigmarchaeota archaeon]